MSHLLAFCYIYRNRDERNKCLLSSDSFAIIKNNEKKEWLLTHVHAIRLIHRKLLFFLVGGGIITSLSFFALSTGRYNPWLTLSLLFIGIYMVYYGWLGAHAIQVSTSRGSEVIQVRSISNNLREFISFVNKYLLVGEEAIEEYRQDDA